MKILESFIAGQRSGLICALSAVRTQARRRNTKAEALDAIDDLICAILKELEPKKKARKR